MTIQIGIPNENKKNFCVEHRALTLYRLTLVHLPEQWVEFLQIRCIQIILFNVLLMAQKILFAVIGYCCEDLGKILLHLRWSVSTPKAKGKYITIELVGSQVPGLLESKGMDLVGS